MLKTFGQFDQFGDVESHSADLQRLGVAAKRMEA